MHDVFLVVRVAHQVTQIGVGTLGLLLLQILDEFAHAALVVVGGQVGHLADEQASERRLRHGVHVRQKRTSAGGRSVVLGGFGRLGLEGAVATLGLGAQLLLGLFEAAKRIGSTSPEPVGMAPATSRKPSSTSSADGFNKGAAAGASSPVIALAVVGLEAVSMSPPLLLRCCWRRVKAEGTAPRPCPAAARPGPWRAPHLAADARLQRTPMLLEVQQLLQEIEGYKRDVFEALKAASILWKRRPASSCTT